MDRDTLLVKIKEICKAEDSDLAFAYKGDGKWTTGINIINGGKIDA